MRKFIGWIGAHLAFWVGYLFSRVSHFKINGRFFFDKKGWRYHVGYWMARQHQLWMHRSTQIQDWAGNSSPWRKVTTEEQIG